ncbi:MAG TPA: hypothetical protein V6D10_12380 [Trichocoleus sp.]|jgi:hypothetical protein
MSMQKFSLEAIQKVRKYIQEALAVKDTEEQSQAWAGLEDDAEPPEPESLDDLSGVFTFGGLSPEDVSTPNLEGYWFVSTVNPAAALLKLPGLQVKPNYRLVSYLYRASQNGIGLVFSLPETLSTTAQLEKVLAKSGGIAQPPCPEGALPNFMEAIEGDRSPVSFMVASILRRELQEFGAVGKRCNWNHHRLIDAIPTKLSWVWRVDPPKDLLPKVKVLPDGQAAVEFFSCRIGESIMLYRHLDQYPAGQYKAASLDKALAVAQR